MIKWIVKMLRCWNNQLTYQSSIAEGVVVKGIITMPVVYGGWQPVSTTKCWGVPNTEKCRWSCNGGSGQTPEEHCSRTDARMPQENSHPVQMRLYSWQGGFPNKQKNKHTFDSKKLITSLNVLTLPTKTGTRIITGWTNFHDLPVEQRISITTKDSCRYFSQTAKCFCLKKLLFLSVTSGYLYQGMHEFGQLTDWWTWHGHGGGEWENGKKKWRGWGGG